MTDLSPDPKILCSFGAYLDMLEDNSQVFDIVPFVSTYQLFLSPSNLIEHLIDCHSNRVQPTQPFLIDPALQSSSPCSSSGFLAEYIYSRDAFLPNLLDLLLKHDTRIPLLESTEFLARSLQLSYPWLSPSIHLRVLDARRSTMAALASETRSIAHDLTPGFSEVFSSLPVSEAAVVLNAAHSHFLTKISGWEIVQDAWSCRADSCLAARDHFNKTVAWIQTICLSSSSLARQLERFIRIAEYCRASGFLSPLLIIISALNSSVLSRLKPAWKRLSSSTPAIFAELSLLCSPTHNYGALRSFGLKNGFTIPLAITIKDVMIRLEYLSPPRAGYPPDAIPFTQMLDLGGLIPDYRSSMRSITTPFADDLYRFLRDPLPRFSEGELFELSYRLLPCANPSLNSHQSFHDFRDPVSGKQVRHRSLSGEKSDQKKRESATFVRRSSLSVYQLPSGEFSSKPRSGSFILGITRKRDKQ